ncbi:hypothetical protein EXIGLDRAFT_842038 [Exidia glandulosa HHB12029]|uniref:Uncharacterized protein n=1 Tax=Exidia glandulosa HHB12029 TaxID=1314781 RepID=A0A165DIX9_EXIGL|nr:hypothetical protein EXIGLDRAFT_842038 [Exidia glandulosa HHB12029]
MKFSLISVLGLVALSFASPVSLGSDSVRVSRTAHAIPAPMPLTNSRNWADRHEPLPKRERRHRSNMPRASAPASFMRDVARRSTQRR